MKHFPKTLLQFVFVLLAGSIANLAQGDPPDTSAKLISAPDFIISAEDDAAGISGTMKFAVKIDKKGDVEEAVIYVGPRWPCGVDLDSRVLKIMRSAENAVKKYKFSPATENGEPVESAISVSMTIGSDLRKDTEPKPDQNAKVIRGGVINGRATYLEKPEYPLAARVNRTVGTVEVAVLIDEAGKLVEAQAVKGPGVFHFTARAAACKSRYSPTLLKGAPVKVMGIITYNFSM